MASAQLAKAEYDRQVFYLLQDKEVPAVAPAGPSLRDLCNQFLDTKLHLVTTGKLSPRSFSRYKMATDTLVSFFDANFDQKRPEFTYRLESLNAAEFTRLFKHLDKGQNPVSLGNEIRHIRIVVKYAYDSEMIDKPIRFGPDFKVPSRDVVRRAEQAHQKKHGKRLLDASELRLMLDTLAGRGPKPLPRKNAHIALRAMILLGLNCGFGQSDCANFEESHVDLDAGWIDYPRVKTAVERRIPLWPETVAALREVLANRYQAKHRDDKGCFFITRYGRRWLTISRTGGVTDTVGECFSRLLVHLGLKRERLSFYLCRHVVETIGSRAKDQKALDRIMGHAPSATDMGAKYLEDFEDERLLAVTNTIREWLFPSEVQR
jgi:integrase